MELKPMRAGHLIAVAALSGQLGYEVTEAELNGRFALLENDPEHRLVVVLQDGRVAGWTHVCLVDGLETQRFAEIRALVVDASARRSGIGRLLVDEAKRWAQQKKVGKLRVRSNVVRDEAHTFYPALGFVLAKTQGCYDLPLQGEPAGR
jgi:GNAT superfamily N-acetyltransferase